MMDRTEVREIGSNTDKSLISKMKFQSINWLAKITSAPIAKTGIINTS